MNNCWFLDSAVALSQTELQYYSKGRMKEIYLFSKRVSADLRFKCA